MIILDVHPAVVQNKKTEQLTDVVPYGSVKCIQTGNGGCF